MEPLDVGLARDTYLEALWAAMFVGRLAGGDGLMAVARTARAAPRPAAPARVRSAPRWPGAADHRGLRGGDADLERALSAFRSESISREEEIRWLRFAGRTAVDLWDDETSEVLAIRHLQIAREAGALSELGIALSVRIVVHINAGELAAAAALVEDVEAVTEATGSHLAPYGALWLAAWRGREAAASDLIEASMREVTARGEGVG